MRLPLNDILVKQLLSANSNTHVSAAHNTLVAAGYVFVGYHGTNARGIASILANGFDPAYVGSSAGLARGTGVYVARYLSLAMDFADTATQAGDPHPQTGAVPRKVGLGGTQAILRVYARNFGALQNGTDYEWGGMGTSLSTSPTDTARQQEIVFRTRTYQQLVAIPTTSMIEAAILGPDAHSDPGFRAQEAPH
jgi:hypothetical protein